MLVEATPMSAQALKMLEDALGSKPQANDSGKALFRAPEDAVLAKKLTDLAKAIKAPVTISMHELGFSVLLETGASYRVTETGDWEKVA